MILLKDLQFAASMSFIVWSKCYALLNKMHHFKWFHTTESVEFGKWICILNEDFSFLAAALEVSFLKWFHWKTRSIFLLAELGSGTKKNLVDSIWAKALITRIKPAKRFKLFLGQNGLQLTFKFSKNDQNRLNLDSKF